MSFVLFKKKKKKRSVPNSSFMTLRPMINRGYLNTFSIVGQIIEVRLTIIESTSGLFP